MRDGLYACAFGLILIVLGWPSAGRAAATLPAGGAPLRLAQEMVSPPRLMVPDTAVTLSVKVPELRKRYVKDAAALLVRVGLQLGRVTTLTADAAEGTVLRQSPGAGQLVKRGSRVDVWVAAAPPAPSNTVKVPNLLKRQIDQAKAVLSKSGLLLGKVTTLASDAAEGTVLRQYPAAGQSAEPRARVDLWVAAAPPARANTVKVPKLLERQVKEAERILVEVRLQLGRVTRLVSDAPEGTVLRQSPAAGQPAEPGSGVDVWVAAAPPTIKVPNLLERQVKEAERILVEARLKLGRVAKLASDALEGTVLRQSPAAGQAAEPGSGVDVWVAAAPPAIKVPNLLERQVKEAERILAEARLQLGRVATLASDAPEGTVLRQSPGPGQSAEPGSRVDVWIARVAMVEVPELRERDLRAARAILTEAGLRLGAAEPLASDAPQGSVVRQEPAPGERVRRGATVRVWVAEALTVTVPDLQGLTLEAAEQRLRATRLSLGAQSRRPSLPPAGEVLEQKPAAGTAVKVGTEVDVVVGEGSRAQVPAIVGDTEGTARERLDVAGLRPGERRTEESDRAEGRILRQQPAAGSVVERGSAVAYWVAVPRLLAVPDIVGLRAGEALGRLAPVGLEGEQAGAEESDRPEGEVLRQDPAPGTRVPRGSRVRFWVAAPVLIPVPALSGLGIDAARTLLSRVGLVLAAGPSQESEAPRDTVIRQEPAAGTPVARGTAVVVRFSAGRASVSPWVVGAGVGAALLAGGAGLWMARRGLRPPKPPGPAAPTVRVHMREPKAAVLKGLSLDPKAPTVRLRTRVVPGGSKVIARKLVVREERRKS